MRKIKSKNNFDDINKSIILVGAIFIVALIIGTYLNKFWPQYEEVMIGSINNLKDVYKSDISLMNIIMTNLKSDFKLMLGISIFTLFIITFPISMLIFIFKGISIGYTINSIILVLKTSGISMVLLSFIKNVATIPGMIVLLIISINYGKEILRELNQKRKDKLIFLGSRYMLNALIISSITVFAQVILNCSFIWIIKFLVK